MKLYSVGVGVLLLLAATTLQTCSEVLASALASSSENLAQSTDPNVKAAGHSAETAERARLLKLRRSRALAPDNLRKAERMDFTDIDLAIRNNPYSHGLYRDRAAMYVAAGNFDEAIRAENQAAGVTERVAVSLRPKELHAAEYARSLADVLTGLTPNSEAWRRVHSRLCAQVATIQTTPEFVSAQEQVRSDPRVAPSTSNC